MTFMQCFRIAHTGFIRAAQHIGMLGIAVLAGCASPPPHREPHESHTVAAEPPPAQTAQVFVYPANGQSAAQLDRDRYECHGWAVRQSGFDPSLPQLPPHERIEVVSMAPPPGANTVAGAATGAIFGAAVSSPWHSGEGAVVGAVAGALLGATADAANHQHAEAVQRHYDQRDLQAQARLEMQARDYRRAIGACLEGRGYTVK
jgi:hypothetical protein